MSEQTQRTRAARRRHFRIESPAGPDWMRLALLASPGLARLQRLREAARHLTDPYAIASLALRGLRITLNLPPADEQHIAVSGAVIITANHPFGALDGLAAIAAIGRRRPDLRILANPELVAMEGIGSLMIPVDPFGGAAASRANSAGLRQALRWLQGGGALLMFPAGEVSNLDLRAMAVLDRPWSATAARLIRLARVPVVPMHFAGANSALFQLAGVLHPQLRTLLLPYELGNKVGSRVVVRTGEPIAVANLAGFSDDADLAAHLRLKTYLLGSASAAGAGSDPHTFSRSPPEPLIPAIDPALLAREIESLPPQTLLVSSGRMQVYCARTAQIPWILQELGRLRELTFCAVGEGTGRGADIDVYDNYYEHLFLWNAERREIVGAYRLGRTDEICRRFGKRGLYTSTLFEYNDIFLAFLGPALELGRSFVRTEHQKSFAALMLLWKGIGEYVGRHPRYCRLIGPVSISNAYRPLSRELLVGFLRRRNFDPLGPALVRPKQPFRSNLSLSSLGGANAALTDIEALSALVADLEPDHKGAPILLRQYLKLGGRMLGFNVDPQFSNALDCLVLVDLRKTPPRVLRKYMSDTAWQRFAGRHRRLRASGAVTHASGNARPPARGGRDG
jgi:putative hemolysin